MTPINPDPKLAMLEIMEKNISGSEFIGEKNPPWNPVFERKEKEKKKRSQECFSLELLKKIGDKRKWISFEFETHLQVLKVTWGPRGPPRSSIRTPKSWSFPIQQGCPKPPDNRENVAPEGIRPSHCQWQKYKHSISFFKLGFRLA